MATLLRERQRGQRSGYVEDDEHLSENEDDGAMTLILAKGAGEREAVIELKQEVKAFGGVNGQGDCVPHRVREPQPQRRATPQAGSCKESPWPLARLDVELNCLQPHVEFVIGFHSQRKTILEHNFTGGLNTTVNKLV